ncbi:DUF1501 domain-containing protein [Vibrio crassostreae]|nr:DUF1501 domain-containing protein [Vibrio crassostreae]CAK2359672.1 DUF1501 domain-containing protein [Vibrio crassostreae]CAK2374133.1 DUF1501 domain-containing protein [Vibrio crassostreae]CAK3470995.1 DUF1501 domain-containing protein [Vibrio crassostreae]
MTNYKALVCINFGGGNDGVNTVVPFDGDEVYKSYFDIRPHIALTESELSDAGVVDKAGTPLALNGFLSRCAEIMKEGKGTAICNIGPLVEPTNRGNYGSVTRPTGLFNHSAQTASWQSSINESGNPVLGWGALIMRSLLNEGVERSEIYSESQQKLGFAGDFRTVNLDGTGIPAASGGLEAFNWNHGNVRESFDKIRESSEHYTDSMSLQYVHDLDEATTTDEVVQEAVKNTALDSRIDRSSRLGRAFSNVKRVIDSHDKYDAKRQMFIINFGGFDNHQNLKAAHQKRFEELDPALSDFLRALEADGLLDQVTTFTTSEFGRRVRGNGNNGSDHGWGSHQMVFGGSVVSGEAVGTMPKYDLEADNMISGQDRLIPEIAHEQYAATLAKWMGVSDSDIKELFPQCSEHFEADLGFLR